MATKRITASTRTSIDLGPLKRKLEAEIKHTKRTLAGEIRYIVSEYLERGVRRTRPVTK